MTILIIQTHMQIFLKFTEDMGLSVLKLGGCRGD